MHCHLPQINPAFNSIREMPLKTNKKTAFRLALKYYCKVLGIKYVSDFRELNKKFERALLTTVNKSIADHVVVLAFDGVYEKGKIVNKKSLLYVKNKTVYELSKKHPKILFGASINPARKDAFNELRKISKLNPALIKMHPTFQLFDPRKYKEFYEKIAQLKIPVLMHTGQETALPGCEVAKKFETIENTVPLLKAGCTVIAAHGGGAFFLKDKKTFRNVLTTLKKYPKLFIDISAIANLHSKRRLIRVMKNNLAMSRSVYGSDFPVIPNPILFLRKIGIGNHLQLKNNSNIISRDILLKKEIGYPDKVFKRGYKIISSPISN